MNRRITFATLLAVLLLLAGCATMNEDECRSADWYSVGFEDGAHGRPTSYIGNHREACAEYGISPRADSYRDGWNQGIRNYCTPRNGYQEGMYGRSRGAECPADLAYEFNDAYQYGQHIYMLDRELSAIDQDTRTAQNELKQITQESARIEKRLMGGGRGDREHDRSNARLRELYRQKADLEAQLAGIDRARQRSPDDSGNKRGRDKDNESDRDTRHDRDEGKDADQDKDKGDDNDNRRLASAPREQGNANQRKHLEQQLVTVRSEIHALETQLDQRERQQDNRELLRRSRQLSQREGQLHAQLAMLHRERLDLEREIDWLKRSSPY